MQPSESPATGRGRLPASLVTGLFVFTTIAALARAWMPTQAVDDLRENPEEALDPPGPDATWANPGTDTCLAFSWEPTVAVDPGNPLIVVVAQGRSLLISFDGGASFPQPLTAPLPSGTVSNGDPSLGFDSQGRLFLSYLCKPASGRDVCLMGYELNLITGLFQPIAGINWPRNVTALAGHGAPSNADKEWLAVDASAASPYTDRLHIVWTDIAPIPWEVWTTWSSDQGQSWSAAQQLSVADEGPKPWPAHNAVAPNGDLYVAWHSQTGFWDPPANRVPNGTTGQIVMRRSTNGGAFFGARSFPYAPSDADTTWNVQHKANGVIPGARYWLQGTSQPWILTDPHQAGRIYVVTSDDPDDDVDSGDAADVFIAISDDNGVSWGAPIRVDSGPVGTFAVLPTAAIDPNSGSIAVTYYDNRLLQTNTAGNFLLDLLVTYSFDSGVTWGVEWDVNDGFFDPDGTTSCRFCCPGDSCFGQPITTRIGEYNGVAYGECGAKMVWADNQTCGTGSSQLDVFFDDDPEGGGDFTPPVLVCPSNTSIGCNDSTDPIFTGMATATDDCTLDPDIGFVDEFLGGNCPPSTVIESIRRIWHAFDNAGNIQTCEQIISIVDFDAPALFGPPDLVLECSEQGGVPADHPAVVAWAAQFTAFDACSDVDESLGLPDFFPAGCGDGGDTLIIYSAADACGNGDFLVRHVRVVDTTPPTIDCRVVTPVLWPPLHQFVNVGLFIDTEDLCAAAQPSIAIQVTSDEHPAFAIGAGGPALCPDAIILPGGTVWVRAQRSTIGDGRVYRITVGAYDRCGNLARCRTFVRVPVVLNQPAVDSGQLYDATDCN